MYLWRSLLSAFVAIACVLPSITLSQEKDISPEKQWEQAKNLYQNKLEVLKENVLKQILAFENKAREHGDIDRVKKYKKECEDFEENGKLPSNAALKYDYRSKLRAAQNELRQAYQLVQIAYLKARKDIEAEELKNEFGKLLDFANTPSAVRPEGMPPSHAQYTNVTYGGFWRHVRGKEWIELNKKKKITSHFTEIARTRQYVEIKRNEKIPGQKANQLRLYSDHVEFKDNNTWKWCLKGHWTTAKQ